MTERQGHLFDSEPAPWEEDDVADQLVATVVFAGGPPGRFDYSVPEPLVDRVEAGRRLRVPLGRGNRRVVGYCVRLATKPTTSRPLKPVSEVVDRRNLITPSMLRLTDWIAEHYLCDLGQVLEAVVPAGVRAQAGTRLTTVLSVDPKAAEQIIADRKATEQMIADLTTDLMIASHKGDAKDDDERAELDK